MIIEDSLTFRKIRTMFHKSLFAVKRLLMSYFITLTKLLLPLIIHTQNIIPYITPRPITEIPPVLKESSGALATSPNAIWSHNDGGNSNHLFCFDTLGNVVRILRISNATNVDWEDLTADLSGRIYIGDVGNNTNTRKDLCIYRIPHPDQIPATFTEAEVIRFSLEDQVQFPPPPSQRNFDIEAICWKDDTLFLFTKNRSTPQSGICKMYKIPAQPGDHIARLAGSVYLGSTDNEARVTSADINHSTGEVILLTHSKIVSFRNYPANNFFLGTRTDYYFTDRLNQPEGICWVDPTRVYLTEERTSRNKPAFLYEIKWYSSSPTHDRIRGNHIKIYPNPFHETITCEGYPEHVVFKITDLSGKFILKSSCTAGFTHDVVNLRPGIYVVWLETYNYLEIIKLVKQ